MPQAVSWGEKQGTRGLVLCEGHKVRGGGDPLMEVTVWSRRSLVVVA